MTLLTFSFIYALGLCLNLEFMVGFFKLIFPFLLLYFVLLLPKDSYKSLKNDYFISEISLCKRTSGYHINWDVVGFLKFAWT